VTLPSPPPISSNVATDPTAVVRWRWWIHLILIGGYLIPRIALSFQFPRYRAALSNSTTGLLAVCAIELTTFALVFGLACFVSRPSREDLLLPWRPGWWVLPLGIGYSIAIRVAAGIVIFIVVFVLIGSHVVTPASAQHFITSKQPDVEKLVDLGAMRDNRTYYWLTVTVVSFIVAGLREELWRAGTLAGLRTLWPRAFGSTGGQIVAVALIAVLFGAAHLPLGLVGAIVAGLLGLFLGMIMIVHRSIWPAVLAHGFLDATTFALIPFALEKLRHLQ
jgi:membrane protease YdiL (CAAX protease family)